MRTSAPGISDHRGFTLIELLVVLLIMGLFVGLVATVVRPDDRALLRVEAERLAQLLELATAQSRLTGQPVGWTSDGTSYRFWRVLDDGAWAEIGSGDALRARTLPQGMSITSLRIEAMRPQGVMRLVFAPDGLAPAFSIVMSLGREHYTLAASPVGELRVLPGEDNGNGAVALR
jgi:general secretion pathway protein H